ncbi:hypothetical protein E2C01_064035 [Portunus trituberculatus]|uniref:Uncharacterized protein n=1 Tax=Portunus trituberculatus TaxID=210409 RepID=A0A5B7HJT1_PORTR|nr:hypothetical protein [Portunus trituberculatus]
MEQPRPWPPIVGDRGGGVFEERRPGPARRAGLAAHDTAGRWYDVNNRNTTQIYTRSPTPALQPQTPFKSDYVPLQSLPYQITDTVYARYELTVVVKILNKTMSPPDAPVVIGGNSATYRYHTPRHSKEFSVCMAS